jgi:hypothetical protein
MYLVRLQGGPAAPVRDGASRSDPMKRVTTDRFELFNNLPWALGVTETGGGGFEIKKLETDAEAKAFLAEREKTLAVERAKREENARKVQAKLGAIKAKQRADAAEQAQAAAEKEAEKAQPARMADIATATPRVVLKRPKPEDKQ